MRTRLTGLRDTARGEALIAVAIGVMNVSTDAYTLVAARVLGPRSFGAFAGMMATLLVLGVHQLGLQATAARRISADPEHVAQIERGILVVTYRAALLLGLVTLVASPVLAAVLRLDSLTTAALVALTVVPLTVMGGQAGVLQGERRWGALATVYLAAGLPRLFIGWVLMVWHPTETNAMLGVALGSVVPVVVGWALLRHPRESGLHTSSHAVGHIGWESLRNSQALLAFFTVSNVDIIVARNVLDQHDAGLYAGGLILTTAVLFLPQFVVVVAFPSMANPSQSDAALRRSIGAVAVLGGCATLASLALSDLALIFVGGEEYDEIAGSLWTFAVLGTLLAMLQLLVYAVLARQGRRSVYLVWAALVLIVAVGALATSVTGLVATVIGVDAVLLAALLGISLYLLRPKPVPAEKSRA